VADQAAAVLPEARAVVLSDVDDVRRLAEDTAPGTVLAILSRETAKLGHAWAPATGKAGVCPRCGADAPTGDALARRRLRCEATTVAPRNGAAQLVRDLALALLPAFADDVRVGQVLRGRAISRTVAVLAARLREPLYAIAQRTKVRRAPALAALAPRLASLVAASAQSAYDADSALVNALASLLVGLGDDALAAQVAGDLYRAVSKDREAYGHGARLRAHARDLLLLLPPGSERQTETAAALRALGCNDDSHYGSAPWPRWERRVAHLATGAELSREEAYDPNKLRIEGGKLHRGERAVGDPLALLDALASLDRCAAWTQSAECGEPLFQAIPEPRRVPLATFISRHYPRLFDLLVADEAQEFSGNGSAQGFAAHRLTALGLPTLLLSGSIMNGYAESLFNNLWALSPAFRAEFDRDERTKFVDRYGYRKRLVEDRDADNKVVEFGSVTDRVQRKERDLGNAPGVLPVLVLRHLLPLAVTLQKADLARTSRPAARSSSGSSRRRSSSAEHDRLKSALMAAVARDRFQAGRAGKLLGALVDFTSYPDRATADVGNATGGGYEIRYPEALDRELVAAAAPRPADDVLPKEAWMLDTVRAELAEGRRVMVLAWHTELAPRLARLIEAHVGEPVALLDARKVDAAERESWIRHHVLGEPGGLKKLRGAPTVRRVLVVNPVAVQTGLNCLTAFASQIYLENPGCNPTVYRQARGRVHRVGQTLPTRIYFPFYTGTTQQAAQRLLADKVSVASAVDGVSPETALEAAGVGDAAYTEHDLGAALYRLLQDEAPAVRAPVAPRLVVARPAAPPPSPAPIPAPAAKRARPAEVGLFGTKGGAGR
jgi:hypothetical protein